MQHVSHEITLKDGRRVRVRTLALEDIPARATLLLDIARENVYTLLTPAEMREACDRMPRKLPETLRRDDALYLIALPLRPDGSETGEVVADFTIKSHEYERMAHVATLGLEAAPAYRGVGLGDALMRIAMQWALAKSTLRRVELWVYAANTPAIALYRKHGFEIEGTRRCAMQWKPGEWHDDHLMARVLK
jgi:RimJ/RimL family protein N-acetyltransferase